MNIAKVLVQALKGKIKPSGYDTTATVRRVEGATAWVNIAGGVEETPVQMSIDAKPGDQVNVRLSGGKAWITGNQTAPPTDDKTAESAIERVGMLEAARDYIGRPGSTRAQVEYDGLHVYAEDGKTQVAHFGWRRQGITQVVDEEVNKKNVPFITLGTGRTDTQPSEESMHAGEYSVAEGINTWAFGRASHAEGIDTQARGAFSHAAGSGTHARGLAQTAIGKNNATTNSEDYALYVGNGRTQEDRSNAAGLKWDGELRLGGNVYVGCDGELNGGAKLVAGLVTESYTDQRTGVSIPPGVAIGLTKVYEKSGFYPAGIVGHGISKDDANIITARLRDTTTEGRAFVEFLVVNTGSAAWTDVTLRTDVLWIKS